MVTMGIVPIKVHYYYYYYYYCTFLCCVTSSPNSRTQGEGKADEEMDVALLSKLHGQFLRQCGCCLMTFLKLASHGFCVLFAFVGHFSESAMSKVKCEVSDVKCPIEVKICDAQGEV